jgi:hypothetical protein
MEQPLPWQTTQAVEPSAADSASVTREKSDGFSSMPPRDFGCSMRKKLPSFSASTMAGVSWRR